MKLTKKFKPLKKDEYPIRFGFGYDVHRIVEGRKLIIGGVRIPSKMGLLGHSDADVLLHAICDALLGAAGLGDIGEHFPDTDNAYRNISSLKLLQNVSNLLQMSGYEIGNIDATLILESPKIGAYKNKIRQKIGSALHVSQNRVSVKATTHEGLGAFGRREGCSAFAIATIISIGRIK